MYLSSPWATWSSAPQWQLCSSARPPQHAGGNVTVARLLDLASAAALTQQPVVPKPDQYVCVKEIFKDFGEGTVLTQYWTPVDDKLSGLIETGNQAPTVATEERPGFYPGMRRAGLDD